jgi:hypothetical protein
MYARTNGGSSGQEQGQGQSNPYQDELILQSSLEQSIVAFRRGSSEALNA